MKALEICRKYLLLFGLLLLIGLFLSWLGHPFTKVGLLLCFTSIFGLIISSAIAVFLKFTGRLETGLSDG